MSLSLFARLPYDVKLELFDTTFAGLKDIHDLRLKLCNTSPELRRFIHDIARYWTYIRIRSNTLLDALNFVLERAGDKVSLQFDINVTRLPLTIPTLQWMQPFAARASSVHVTTASLRALDWAHAAFENVSAPKLLNLSIIYRYSMHNPDADHHAPIPCRHWFRNTFPVLETLALSCVILPFAQLSLPVLRSLHVAGRHITYTLELKWLYDLLAESSTLTDLSLKHAVFFDPTLPDTTEPIMSQAITRLQLAFSHDDSLPTAVSPFVFPNLTHFTMALARREDVEHLHRCTPGFFSRVTHLTVYYPPLRSTGERTQDFATDDLFAMFAGVVALDIHLTNSHLVHDLSRIAAASLADGRGPLFPLLRTVHLPCAHPDTLVTFAQSQGACEGSDGSHMTLRCTRVGPRKYDGPATEYVAGRLKWLEDHTMDFRMLSPSANFCIAPPFAGQAL